MPCVFAVEYMAPEMVKQEEYNRSVVCARRSVL